MNPLEQQLQRIGEKLQLLLKQYQVVQKENERLTRDLAVQTNLSGEQSKEIDELRQKVVILKTATNNLSPEDKKDLEKRLNFYIKEVDRCIALLGS